MVRGSVRFWLCGAVVSGMAISGFAVSAQAELRILGNPKDYTTALSVEAQSQPKCELAGGRVFARHAHGSHCIAYYVTPNIDASRSPVLFFDGDVTPEMFRDRKRTDDYFSGVRKAFDGFAERTGVPLIYVSRPGLFGSSGNHGFRRSHAEAHALNKAVDAIKARYGFKDVVLAGQSGGAWAVAALLTLGRTDVACAVGASGGFDLIDDVLRTARKRGKPIPKSALESIDFGPFYDVIRHTQKIQKVASRRFFVIGDVRDTRTPFEQQKKFGDKVKAGGHHAVVISAQATDQEHHGLSVVAVRTAVLCSLGRPDTELERQATQP